MIPKVIYYCWFGHNPKPDIMLRCMDSWRTYAPGFEIREINESNFDVNSHPYTRDAYANRKWAFVSDYARLRVLYDNGGVYLDMDMLLVKDITPLLVDTAFIGYEDDVHVNAAIVGAVPDHLFIAAIMGTYDGLSERTPIPIVVDQTLAQGTFDLHIYSSEYFYPYSVQTINAFTGQAPSISYAVHLWEYSWGSPLSRFIRRTGVYYTLKSITEYFHIKSLLKRILRME